MKVIGKLGAEPFVPFLPLLTREFDVTTLIVYVMPVFTSCLRAWITQSVYLLPLIVRWRMTLMQGQICCPTLWSHFRLIKYLLSTYMLGVPATMNLYLFYDIIHIFISRIYIVYFYTLCILLLQHFQIWPKTKTHIVLF